MPPPAPAPAARTTPATDRPLLESNLALPGRRAGKVRDIYELPDDLATLPERGTPALLLVASDRISAFDVVMPTPIPGKGRLLTVLSVFWLRFIEKQGICATHLLATEHHRLADRAFKPGGTVRDDLAGRIMICRRTRVVPIECVVRGYLEGSGWKEYQASGSVCGVTLPAGLRQCDKLPQPIFTPATKEDVGKHDENISFDRACTIVGRPLMETLRTVSLAIYEAASAHARARGIIIADTKFEFGIPIEGKSDSTDQAPILIDEALTPDSSRFWPVDGYAPGGPQKSFDKQFLREYLESLVAAGSWNKQAPGPRLPDDITAATLAKYREARDRLLG
ncbi:MAG TPA: phosphoribosylaminoimidazolesuccinocarboxamide synthase [Phycisphaerales bacterium]|nr:phosphoribosylaminoimidazolesuccinocarboxamide synthase [Phycisphaerales bacterium]